MNKKLLITLVIALCIVLSLAVVSCNQWDTPYENFNDSGATLSVKYRANGGVFEGLKNVTIVDVYDLDKAIADGGITLVEPNDDVRGEVAFQCSRTNCKLEGWYVTTVNEDGSYTVTNQKWDFSKKYTFDVSKKYSSETPILVLSAMWVPYNTFNVFVQNEDGSFPTEPTYTKDTLNFRYPVWDTNTGKLDYKDYPEVSGKTFDKAYTDATLTTPVTGNVSGSARYDEASGEFISDVVNLYAQYKEGTWYEITTARQLANNANVNGYYNIRADLDFTSVTWPTAFANGKFNGAIYGNGYTISNVKAQQSNATNYFHGLFGTIDINGVIENLTITNSSFTIVSGMSNVNEAPSYYGFLAGKLDGTLTNVSITNSKIILSNETKGCMFDMVDNVKPSQVYKNLIAGLFQFNLGVGQGDYSFDVSTITIEFSNPEAKLFINGIYDKYTSSNDKKSVNELFTINSADSDGYVTVTKLP